MLDVSIRIGLLNVMKELRDNEGVSILYITHDLASARYVADRMIVLYAGRIAEEGLTDEVIGSPQHPYTRLLMSSAPDPHLAPTAFEGDDLGEPPKVIDPGPGCRFAARCPLVMDECRVEHAAHGDDFGHPSRGLLRSEAVVDVALVPRPRSLDVRSGTVTWTSPVRVFVESDWRDVVATFARDLETSIGWAVEFVDAADAPDALIRRVADCGDEGYRLAVDTEVTIDASSAAGVAYALTTFCANSDPIELWSSGATLESIRVAPTLHRGRSSLRMAWCPPGRRSSLLRRRDGLSIDRSDRRSPTQSTAPAPE